MVNVRRHTHADGGRPALAPAAAARRSGRHAEYGIANATLGRSNPSLGRPSTARNAGGPRASLRRPPPLGVAPAARRRAATRRLPCASRRRAPCALSRRRPRWRRARSAARTRRTQRAPPGRGSESDRMFVSEGPDGRRIVTREGSDGQPHVSATESPSCSAASAGRAGPARGPRRGARARSRCRAWSRGRSAS